MSLRYETERSLRVMRSPYTFLQALTSLSKSTKNSLRALSI